MKDQLLKYMNRNSNFRNKTPFLTVERAATHDDVKAKENNKPKTPAELSKKQKFEGKKIQKSH